MKSNSHLKFNKVSIKGQGKDILFYKLDNSLNFMRDLLAMKWGLLGIKVKWENTLASKKSEGNTESPISINQHDTHL